MGDIEASTSVHSEKLSSVRRKSDVLRWAVSHREAACSKGTDGYGSALRDLTLYDRTLKTKLVLYMDWFQYNGLNDTNFKSPP